MARVFVTRRLPGPSLGRLGAEHDVRTHEGSLPPTREELERGIAEADGLLCLLTDRIDAALLEQAPSLRVISNYAVGSDNIDLDAARARGIPVGVTPGVLTEATADLTFALILAAARHIVTAARDVESGNWRTWEPQGWLGADVHGATLAIVGAGRIGEAVAKRASGFDMNVLRVKRDGDLHAALRQADFVSLHTPLTAQTHHLVGELELEAMKQTAILVNTARGAIVDQEALTQALNEGWIAGAALDVTDPEPPAPDDPLLRAPNLLLVPHIGSASRHTRERMTELAVDNLLAGLTGRPLPHEAR